MAAIRERPGRGGTVYQVEIRLKGHRPVRRTFARRTDARRWLVQTEAAIRERRYFRTAEAEKHTLSELLERYRRELRPSTAVETQLAWWEACLGDRRLADVTSAAINEQKANLLRTVTRRNTPMTPATVNRYLAALSHCLNIAVGWEWLEISPMAGRRVRKEREPSGRVRYLDDDERNRLLAACQAAPEPLLYPLVALALSTGARAGELTHLRWPDLDLKKGLGVLHDTKNGERRALPVKGHALAELKALKRQRRLDTDLVFPSPRGVNPFDYKKSFTRAVAEANIRGFRFHDLRHSAASYLAMNGASMPEIAAVLGHKTLAMVKRYAHLSDAHVAKAVESMNEKIFGKGA